MQNQDCSQPPGSRGCCNSGRTDSLVVSRPTVVPRPLARRAEAILLAVTTPSQNRSALRHVHWMLTHSGQFKRSNGRELRTAREICGLLLLDEVTLVGSETYPNHSIAESRTSCAPGHQTGSGARRQPVAAKRWGNITAFVPPRFVELCGRNSLTGRINAELESRRLPPTERVEVLHDQFIAQRQFVRIRRHGGCAPPCDASYAVRLQLCEPVTGAIALADGCHVGLGLLEAEQLSTR